MLIKCPYCIKLIDSQAKKCPYCQEWINEKDLSSSNITKNNNEIETSGCLLILFSFLTLIILSCLISNLINISGSISFFISLIILSLIYLFYKKEMNLTKIKSFKIQAISKLFELKKIDKLEAEKLFNKNNVFYVGLPFSFPKMKDLIEIKHINNIFGFDNTLSELAGLKFQNETVAFYRKRDAVEMIYAYSITGFLCFSFIIISFVSSTIKPEELKQNTPTQTSQKEEIDSNKPKSSPWDGSVGQVYNYLKENLKDPDSYQSIDWSPINSISTGYAVRHKYRSKNSFGGYVISNQLFTMDKNGNVTGFIDY